MQRNALFDASVSSRAIHWSLPVAVNEPTAVPANGKILDLMKGVDARRLFKLERLEVEWDEPAGALWTFMRPRGRPTYSLELLDDLHAWQRGIAAMFDERPAELHYLLLGSRAPGAFDLDGDLAYFLAKIRARDRQALVDYGRSCVHVLHRNMQTLGLPMITIGLAQGDALNAGFELLLSFDLIIAERDARFGFPQAACGLFPATGACSIVARRVNAAFAEEMMLSGRLYSAEEMKQAGLVHMVVEPGQGIEAARHHMQHSRRRHSGALSIFKTGRAINPITPDELDGIVQIWADACLKLRERELAAMQRQIEAQDEALTRAQAAE
jgi:DSF synthase